MAKPKKPSPSKQKPADKKKTSPKKTPAKAKIAKPSKPVKEVSAPKKTAAKKHAAKPVVKEAPKVKKPLVKKELSQHSPAKKSAKPDKAAAPVRAEKTPKAKPDRKHKQPDAPKGKVEAPKGVPREIGKGKGEPSALDNRREKLRKSILEGHGKKEEHKFAAFTLDEAREIAKQHAHAADKSEENAAIKIAAQAKANSAKLAKAAAPTHVKAASLADILGFNPKKAKPELFAPVESVPEKYRRFYKELLDLRASLTEGLDLHTEQTLRRSTKEDAGDLSSYGQHMADAGTDTFDRDFALSMVANEQEALTEIDAAISRIQKGTYGICEITGKPIAKDRLLAVPFTRYSAEAQKDLERNRMRVRTAAGLFGGEINDDNGRVDDSGGGGEE